MSRDFVQRDALWISPVGKRYVYPGKGSYHLAPGEQRAMTRTVALTPAGDRQAFLQALERIAEKWNKRSVVIPHEDLYSPPDDEAHQGGPSD